MKKFLPILFGCICLPFCNAFSQIQPVQEYNRWGLKSIGVSAAYGAEKFFKPLTFSYFEQNAASHNPAFFKIPPGTSDNKDSDLDDVTPMGLGLQLAWPTGKKHNELRAGFAFQQHRNNVSLNSIYNISPDTIRIHEVGIRDEYVISQASFDYVMYTRPLLRNARIFGSIGGVFGVSTRHDYILHESVTELDTADIHFSGNGNYSYNLNKAISIAHESSVDSSPRLEGGIRASAGVEIILNIFHQQIGFSGEYGHGLAAQKILNGGTSNFKRTELGKIQVRYFLK